MTANHKRSLIDIPAKQARNTRDLQGQVSSATPKRGLATLSAGTVTVALTSVTAANQIHLTIQTPGGTVGAPYVFSKTAGTGFVIHSTSGTDTSVVAYAIF